MIQFSSPGPRREEGRGPKATAHDRETARMRSDSESYYTRKAIERWENEGGAAPGSLIPLVPEDAPGAP